jgi:cation-transporting ATPase 13A3/4/5
MYGMVETLIQILNAYFHITFADWCWVFMDGIWLMSMAFSLPLSKPADKLASKRPTASLFGPYTMCSTIGSLLINYLFIFLAIVSLHAEDWFQCRKWESRDVSNVLTIGDNYESETIFLIAGYQYVASGMAFNLSVKDRAPWYKNRVFISFALLWTLLHFTVTLVPSHLSCVFRVNCTNENVVRGVVYFQPQPINNPFHTTLMPIGFRLYLLFLMVSNLGFLMGWEWFLIGNFWKKCFTEDSALVNIFPHHSQGSSSSFNNVGKGASGLEGKALKEVLV